MRRTRAGGRFYAYPDSFEWHIVDSLQHLGCAVQLFHHGHSIAGIFGLAEKALHKTTSLLLREPERRFESRLFRANRSISPTVILVILGSQVSPKTMELIRNARRHALSAGARIR